MITWGLWYWPMGLIITSLLFLPAEIFALATNSLNTLSDYSYYELHMQTAAGRITNIHTIAWWGSLVAWLLFVVVITGHIWLRNPAG